MPSSTSVKPAVGADFRRILGINFYVGDMAGLISLTHAGGLVVVPAAPALVDLPTDPAYRAALERSDFAITDSGFMVWLWLLRRGEWLQRISGLKYLRALMQERQFCDSGATFWIMPSEEDAAENLHWLRRKGLLIERRSVFVAPKYPKGPLSDQALLAAIESERPKYVVINLGGGVQERLGLHLRDNLSYRPAIICTGAAIAFLSGRQANIPSWADRLILGWLFRTLEDPRRFIPRYWKALSLVPILFRHQDRSVAPPTH